MLCLGGAGREYFFSFDSHGLAAIHTVVLGALMVWLVATAGRLRLWQLGVIAVAAGALSALPVSSESGFLIWALVPMVATAALLSWRTRRREHYRVLAVSLVIAVIALVGGSVLSHVLQDSHWLPTAFGVAFTQAGGLVSNTVLLVQSYLFLGGGEFFGAGMDFHGLTVAASGLLIMAVLVALIVELAERWRHAEQAPVSYDHEQTVRFAYIGFWATCLVATSASYVFSDVAMDPTDARYVLTGYIAICALLALLAGRSSSWRILVVAGVSLFAAIAAFQIVRKPFAPGNSWPNPRQANALVHIAEQEHVTIGYASYWVAADLTWLSYFKVHVYPVLLCAVPIYPPTTYCPFDEQRISSWYKAQHDTRSMLIVDPKESMFVGSPDPLMGKPASIRGADGLAVYIYNYDIASHLNQGI